MYSFSYLEPFSCSMSSSNCCFLTCIQISQETGQVVWYSHLFQKFPQFIVIHTFKGFGIVNKAEIDVFLYTIYPIYILYIYSSVYMSGFPSISAIRILLQCRRCLLDRRYGFNPWVRKIHWRRKWLSTPEFFPGKFHGQRSLAGFSPWGRKRVRRDLATKQQQQHCVYVNPKVVIYPSSQPFSSGNLKFIL